MTSRWIMTLGLSVALATTLAAQDRQPPAKGKKEPAAESSDIVARVAKDLQSAEERLKKTDPGDLTRKIQRDIVDGLDELIKQNTKSPSGGGGGTSKSSKTKSGSQQKNSGANPNAGNEKGDAQDQQQDGKKGNEGPDDQPGKAKGGKDQGPQTEDKGKGKGEGDGKDDKEGVGKGGGKDDDKDKDKGQAKGNEPGKDGGQGGLASIKTDKSKTNLTAEMYRNDWGHLPLMKRLEMDAYSRERFMPRYDDILRQYYRTIAEQGQRKDNEP